MFQDNCSKLDYCAKVVYKFGDNINTDDIIAGKYKFKTLNMSELLPHLFESIVPDFYKRIHRGDFIAAGCNFGCGSSREQAPLLIKAAGISAVLAKSFARIFYRNAINIGLIVIEVDTTEINVYDKLRIDIEKGIVQNLSTGKDLHFTPMPKFIQDIIATDGIVNYINRYGIDSFSQMA